MLRINFLVNVNNHGSTILTFSHFFFSGYDLNRTSNILSYHVGSLIVNYFQDEGFLFNGASGQVFGDTGRVEFKPWALTFDGWEEQYTSLYDCPINDGTNDDQGGLYYYSLGFYNINAATSNMNVSIFSLFLQNLLFAMVPLILKVSQ